MELEEERARLQNEIEKLKDTMNKTSGNLQGVLA